jgi:hypothetical protein
LFVILSNFRRRFLHGHDLLVTFKSVSLLSSLSEVLGRLRYSKNSILRLVGANHALLVPGGDRERRGSVLLAPPLVEARV